jgi:hypothetical protein
MSGHEPTAPPQPQRPQPLAPEVLAELRRLAEWADAIERHGLLYASEGADFLAAVARVDALAGRGGRP